VNTTSHWLFKQLSSFSDTAFILDDTRWTYAQTVDAITTWLSVLAQQTMGNNCVVAITGELTPNALALFIALVINKHIILPLSLAADTHKSSYCELAGVEVIFTFTKTDYSVIKVTNTIKRSPYYQTLYDENSAGLILFSSGSTGKSKAMVLNLDKLIEKFKKQRKSYSTLSFMQIDHIGGINTFLYTVSQGGTFILVQNRSVENICRVIEKERVELLPTTPTFLNMLFISGLYKQYDLSSLKLITYGSELMPEHTLKMACQVFPTTTMKQTYGLSETGILSTKSEKENSLWIQLNKNIIYQVINNELYLKIETPLLGYLNHVEPMHADGWFKTADLVEVKHDNGNEYIKFLGRKTDIINVGGEKVYPIEVENVLLQMPNICEVSVSGKKNPVMGEIVVATVLLSQEENIKDLHNRMRAFCHQRLEPYKIPMLINIKKESLHTMRYKKVRN
jgi:long-chain acyl-CoA synthetase